MYKYLLQIFLLNFFSQPIPIIIQTHPLEKFKALVPALKDHKNSIIWTKTAMTSRSHSRITSMFQLTEQHREKVNLYFILDFLSILGKCINACLYVSTLSYLSLSVLVMFYYHRIQSLIFFRIGMLNL